MLKEAPPYFNYLTLHYNLFDRGRSCRRMACSPRVCTRRWRAPSIASIASWVLIYPWKDIGAARYAIEHGDARLRASALEYIDNLLSADRFASA